jgi:hypothetical protein
MPKHRRFKDPAKLTLYDFKTFLDDVVLWNLEEDFDKTTFTADEWMSKFRSMLTPEELPKLRERREKARRAAIEVMLLSLGEEP